MTRAIVGLEKNIDNEGIGRLRVHGVWNFLCVEFNSATS